ncbi:hypothetical protein EJ110_NYTH36533 [Nymphaea thermarum]|nr:hypothetical protein EJ110_NYTH36533 [Nymphaea thermarum]
MQTCYPSGFLLPHHHHHLLLSLPPPALRHQNRSSRTPPACSAIPSPASGEVVPQILNNHSSSPAAAAAPAAAVVKKPYQQRNGVRWSQRRAAIVQIQEADDLRSALSSFQGQLQVQDLNTILRYFGESKRWNDVMQVPCLQEPL